MILPTKCLSINRSLIGIGAYILEILIEPKTVSQIWEEFKSSNSQKNQVELFTYDWFVLALDVLYIIGVIKLEKGQIQRVKP